MHSLYEIETTVKRSAKAQGLSWGVSEEIGKAIRFLEQAEMKGLEAFNRLIEKGLDNLIKLKDIDQKNKNNLCPIHLGLFYLDQSHKKNLHREIKIDELIEPLITIPFLLKAAKKNLIYFHFNHKQFDLSISPSDVISLSNIDIPKSLNNFSLMITAKRKTNYSEETWNKLYKLSLETFVEETEGKKLTGAGAGLTDND